MLRLQIVGVLGKNERKDQYSSPTSCQINMQTHPNMYNEVKNQLEARRKFSLSIQTDSKECQSFFCCSSLLPAVNSHPPEPAARMILVKV